MDWLSDNTVANMAGPRFLLLYGVVIVITLGACWWGLRQRIASLSADDSSSSEDSFWGSTSWEEALSACWRIKIRSALIVGGLGGYKLVVALGNGRYNVLFLIGMALTSLWIVFAMCPMPARESER